MTRRQKRRLAVVFVIILGAVGGSYFALSGIDVSDYVHGSGYVTTPLRSEVRSAEKRPVKNILVKDGARVEKGQVLVELEDADLLGAIEERKAEVSLIEAQLERQLALNKEAEKKHKASLKLAGLLLENGEQELVRARKLLEREEISPEEFEKKLLDLEVSRHRLQAESGFSTEAMQKEVLVLQRRAELAWQQLRKTSAMLEKRKIVSPIPGVLSLHTLTVGEVVDPGRVLGEVFDDSSFVIRVRVAERHLHKVKARQDALASLAAYPHDRFGYLAGEVETIPEIVTPLKAGEGYFVVEVAPRETALPLRPGLSADVRIRVGVTSLLNKLVHVE